MRRILRIFKSPVTGSNGFWCKNPAYGSENGDAERVDECGKNAGTASRAKNA